LTDTREGKPYNFPDFNVEYVSLPAGDYSVKNYYDKIAIERKSLGDLFSSLGVNRDKFNYEIERLTYVEQKHIIIEGTLDQCLHPERFFSKIHPNSVMGSLISLAEKGIQVWLAGNHRDGNRLAKRILERFVEKEGKKND